MLEQNNKSAQVFIMSAPSGAGKTSLCDALLRDNEDIIVAISHTTRLPREGEKNGREYHFVNKEKFECIISADGFLEYANVFGNYYGTSVSSIEDCIQQGKNVILEIDWQGAQKVRKRMPEVKSIFIMPPTFEALESRLRNRGTDNDDVINSRLEQAVEDVSHYDEYDYVVINDDFDSALTALREIFTSNGVGSDKAVVKALTESFR